MKKLLILTIMLLLLAGCEYDSANCEEVIAYYEQCDAILDSVEAECVDTYGEDYLGAGGDVPKSDKNCTMFMKCVDAEQDRDRYHECFVEVNKPERCSLPSGVACLDFAGDKDTITMIIQNSAGFDMANVAVSVDKFSCADAQGDATLTDGEKDTFTCQVQDLPSRFEGAIVLDYTNKQTGKSHSKAGVITLNI